MTVTVTVGASGNRGFRSPQVAVSQVHLVSIAVIASLGSIAPTKYGLANPIIEEMEAKLHTSSQRHVSHQQVSSTAMTEYNRNPHYYNRLHQQALPPLMDQMSLQAQIGNSAGTTQNQCDSVLFTESFQLPSSV